MVNAKSTVRILCFTVLVSTLLTGCSTRRSLPLEGPLTLTEKEQQGEKIFMQHCQRCHPHGEAGLGPAINPAPSFGKRFQIRHGLGAMPAFDENLIADKELDQVISYLKALKNND